MRKLVGMLALLIFLAIYVIAAMLIGVRLTDSHWLLQLLFYLLAGICWALPLRPLMRWMHAKDEPLPSSDI